MTSYGKTHRTTITCMQQNISETEKVIKNYFIVSV